MKFLLTLISGNRKLGGIPVTTVSRKTCSSTCPFYKSGCYALGFPLRLHWDRVTKGEAGLEWPELLRQIRKFIYPGQLWRWAQAGDVPGEGHTIDAKMLAELTEANRNRRGFGFTHKPVLPHQVTPAIAKANRAAIKAANKGGFTLNLSANNLAHADELLKLKIAPVVAVVPSTQVTNCKTPAGNRAVVCPASIRDNVTCARCGLCQRKDRDYVICFPSHGHGAAKVDAIAQTGAPSPVAA